MNKGIGFLILIMILAVSCPSGGPIVPTDHPGGEHEPNAFCIDFERANNEGAINGANALLLYRELGITFPSNPEIINNGALCGGAGPVPGPIRNQCLIQGDPGSARPERSCGPLEILVDPSLEAGKITFEARNVGLISIPVEIVATAYDDSGAVDEFGELIPVDQVRIVSQSELGDLRPVEFITLVSDPSELPITRVVVEYGTCPPHVVINDLCVTPKERTVGTIGQSDAGADRLVYYFDNRGRESSFQLANISSSEVRVHVQIWMANSTVAECEEIDFYDIYTPFDVHTYDTLDLNANSAPISFSPETLAGKYGFVVVSKSEGPSDSLIGSMRIHDFNGFEFKTNAVAPESVTTSSSKYGIVNFNNINDFRFADLIGFTYSETSESDTVLAYGVSSIFGSPGDEVLILDENENITSCSPVQFSCSTSSANIGIDNSLPSARGSGRVCASRILGPRSNSGFLKLPFNQTVCTERSGVGDAEGNCRFKTHFVGFIGLSGGTDLIDSSNYGTFDSWWGGKH